MAHVYPPHPKTPIRDKMQRGISEGQYFKRLCDLDRKCRDGLADVPERRLMEAFRLEAAEWHDYTEDRGKWADPDNVGFDAE